MIEYYLRAALALTFAVAAVAKAYDFRSFRSAVAIVAGHRFAPVLAIAVVSTELATAAVLAGGFAPLVGYVAAIVLLGAFSVFIGLAMKQPTAVLCSCFGSGSGPVAAHHLWRNGFLALLGLAGVITTLVGPATEIADQPWLGGALLGAGVLTAYLVANWDQFHAIALRRVDTAS